MIIQVDVLRMIAEFIGVVFYYSRAVLSPIGEVMKFWIEAILILMNTFIPSRVEIYFIIFIVLVISGVIINYHWPEGEKKGVKEKEKKEMDISAKKCKYCGKSIGDSEFCPYCGSRN